MTATSASYRMGTCRDQVTAADAGSAAGAPAAGGTLVVASQPAAPAAEAARRVRRLKWFSSWDMLGAPDRPCLVIAVVGKAVPEASQGGFV